MKRFIGTAEVASLTGFSERQVRTWCKDGVLKNVEQPSGRNGKYLIPVSALIRFYADAEELQTELDKLSEIDKAA